tara:strand:+ start:876 stop:1097 length:222 start_codon:yes stop_codon:yes gene_type:complete
MKKMEKYIKTRMEQLKDDMSKAHNEHDRMWYNRCIQELDWALQMQSEPTHDCYMGKKDEVLKEHSRHLSGLNW